MLHQYNILSFVGSLDDVFEAIDYARLKPFKAKYADWMQISKTWYDGVGGELNEAGIEFVLAETPGRAQQRIYDRNSNLNFECELDPGDLHFENTGNAAIDLAVQDCGDSLVPVQLQSLNRQVIRLRHDGAVLEIIAMYDDSATPSRDHKTAREDSSEPLANGPVPTSRIKAGLTIALISGDDDALYSLAEALIRPGALWLSPENISITSPPTFSPISMKAKKPNFTGDENPADALGIALGLVATRMCALAPAIARDRDYFAVYQMRVALRRFRAIERTYRPYLGASAFRHLGVAARDFGRVLGPARDWDIFVMTKARKFAPAISNLVSLEAFLDAADQHRTETMDAAIIAINSKAFRDFLLAVARIPSVCQERDVRALFHTPLRDFASDALDRRYASTFRNIGRTDQRYDDGRHQVRLALKKLRYSMQLFQGLYPKVVRAPLQGRIKALQDGYGELNDAAKSIALANEIVTGDEQQRLQKFWDQHHASDLEALRIKVAEDLHALREVPVYWRAAFPPMR